MVTNDLAPTPEPTAVAPRTGTRGAQRTVAVMSESRFSGVVLAGQPVRATAVLGAVLLDLRRTDLPHGVQVRVVGVLGETTVVVPRGCRCASAGSR